MGKEDRVAFITGPARGIGEAVARRLAGQGIRLALAGLEAERIRLLAAELGPNHLAIDCDVTSQLSMETAVALTLETFGRIDVVVANAGIATNGTVAVTPMRDLARVIDVNLTGVIRTVSTTLEAMTESRGYYLLVSSAAAIAVAPGIAAYAASKSGVEQFGNALSVEVAHRGIAVGVAHPSWIDTDLVRDTQRDLQTFRKMLTKLPGPFGKVTSLEECADAFVEGIAKRQRKIFVPRSLAKYAALRTLFSSRLADRIFKRDATRFVPRMESEVKALGRSFGENSVGSGE